MTGIDCSINGRGGWGGGGSTFNPFMHDVFEKGINSAVMIHFKISTYSHYI